MINIPFRECQSELDKVGRLEILKELKLNCDFSLSNKLWNHKPGISYLHTFKLAWNMVCITEKSD